MSTLSSLPAELLEAIFEPLSIRTLAALARTSSDLYASASRLLYRHLSISTHARNLSAVTTLATRSHLALLVRSFSISVDEGQDQLDHGALYQALRGMTNVTHLEVHVDASQTSVLFNEARSPDQTQYPNLENFSCSFPLDANVARFLEGTPSLRSLQLSTSPDCTKLARAAIPLLETYTGPSCLLPQILPSRPITTLLLSGDLTLAEIESLAARAHDAAGTTAIETLSAITSTSPVTVIEALAQACPNLLGLRVITTVPFWETPDGVSSFVCVSPGVSVS
jgi:hypothetical protein